MHPRAKTLRAIPVLLAFSLNLLAGPMLPVAQQTLVRAAADGIDDYAQCQIGNPRPAGLDCAEKWTNGILNATHNQYAEDEVVPQRLLMDFGAPGAHSVTISYMTRKDSGTQNHAYDYLATWNYTYVNADRCQTPTATDCILGAASTFPIPSDPNSVSPGGPQPTSAHEGLPATATHPAGRQRQFVMYGGTITGTSAITHSVDPAEAGSDYGNITVNFTVGAGGKVQLLFGGHLASGLGPRGWGENLGSASISGGPYHIRITAIDDESIGNRDNQIMSNAITPLLPSLVINKTADAASVNAGSNIGFSITVTNSGPGVASAVTLSDPLPFGTGVDWTISPAYAGPGTCSITGTPPAETLNCSFGDMADDASASVHVQSTTTAASCKAYPNTATADASNFDPVMASATTTVDCPVLSIQKTTSTPVVTAGGVARYTITVSNSAAAGTGTATGVAISDALPTGLTWEEDPDMAECVISGGNSLSCTNISLAPGASFSVTVKGTTDAGDCPSILNRATFTSANDGSGASHPEGQGVQISVLCPDASISKSGNGPISAGQTATFTIVVTAGGTGDSAGAVLTDDLPAGLTWALGSANDEAACSIDTALNPDRLSCNFGAMVNGSTRTVVLNGVADAGECPQISNTATVSATVDVNPNNNSSTAVVAVQCPGMNITKVADKSPIDAGEVASYTMVVWNSGPGTALGATFHDELPDDVNWSIQLLNGDADDACSVSSSAIPGQPVHWSADCQFGDLPVTSMANGKQIRISGVTDRADCGTLDNNAFADADNDDQVGPAEASITVKCVTVRVPTLVVDKAASTELVHFVLDTDGDVLSVMPATVTWTLSYTLTNGPVTDAVLTDPLPGFLNFVSASNGGTFAAGVITWNLGTLTSSGSVTFVTTVDPDAPETSPIVNVATIDSSETAPDQGQDSIRLISAIVLAGTPAPSVPNTALAYGQNGEPVSIPVELMLVLFVGSLGTLALANVRAARRRR